MSLDAKPFADAPPDAAGPPARGAAVPAAANSTAPTVPLRPFAGRPSPVGGGLRLLPLDGFHWGSSPRPGMPRTARVRGDNVLMRVAAGGLRLIMPTGAEDYGPGSVIFIPAGSAFGTLPLRDAAGQVLLVPRDIAQRLAVPLPARRIAGTDAQGGFAGQLAALADETGAAARASAPARVELLPAALHRLAAAPAGVTGHRTGQGGRALFDAFVDLTSRELGRGRTLADLAEALGTTAGGLDAVCRTHRGCSALELTYAIRIERACAMLRDRNCPTAQVAAELGFTGIAHLNRAFMAATGRPAEAFRPR